MLALETLLPGPRTRTFVGERRSIDTRRDDLDEE
jgi:hypothetical protein